MDTSGDIAEYVKLIQAMEEARVDYLDSDESEVGLAESLLGSLAYQSAIDTAFFIGFDEEDDIIGKELNISSDEEIGDDMEKDTEGKDLPKTMDFSVLRIFDRSILPRFYYAAKTSTLVRLRHLPP